MFVVARNLAIGHALIIPYIFDYEVKKRMIVTPSPRIVDRPSSEGTILLGTVEAYLHKRSTAGKYTINA